MSRTEWLPIHPIFQRIWDDGNSSQVLCDLICLSSGCDAEHFLRWYFDIHIGAPLVRQLRLDIGVASSAVIYYGIQISRSR